MQNPGDKIEEEIAFWRRFIQWWEQRHGTPAPKRMRDALVFAERRENLQKKNRATQEDSTLH
ncbi:MAG: hypothetical protein U9Q81_22425 [Pseudomonadota bacterium]|nr:hypothetical protein [Pseudomonadota bacterium]